MPNLNAKLLRDELAKIIGGTWPRRRRGSGANKTLWGDEAAREAVAVIPDVLTEPRDLAVARAGS